MPEGPPNHYFSARPTARSKPGRARLELPEDDHALVLRTDAGVFSAGGVDPGTRVLLEDGARPEPTDRVIADVGCGYGPITIALARRAPDAVVWAIDVNERALELTAANAEALGVGDRVRVATPDAVPSDLVVDRFWSNPPIRVGKAALHDVLATWLARVAPGGGAHLVVGKNLGADSLHRWLADQGHSVTRRASRKGYRLLDVVPGG
ncbi:methyltransferase [Iamia sp. SCSIO 61187]|uniref:class I SAM-dependent methyltransferase n=1 Tax=Iamia sp. SCSIO 61187 TaxID=2722752 RepID=UPI001C62A8C0|nr:methyltransferase [Iamia sp. SCSIO 61187]QYG93080.1 methyltransferase [Iamia sp. SCSIO 61187]